MNIILVSNRLKTAKTLHITPRFLIGGGVALILSSLVLSCVFSWLGVRFNLPFVADLVAQEQQKYNQKAEEFMRDNISAMAVKLGEMQAQVLRLDSLGERISKLSGISSPKSDQAGKSGSKDANKDGRESRDGKGGPLVNPSLPFSPGELEREIERISDLIESRQDELTVLESQLMEKRIKSTLLPTLMPITVDRVGSPFGRRVDPIVGVGAMHEGLDFPADTGTPISAAAGGVVAVAEFHPQYGNMIEIDHGNDFSSRYAHMSRLDVKAGQVIKRGQPIGASGNTGRSTGPHLHFEVRFKGVAQDPARFLQQPAQTVVASVAPEAGAGQARKGARVHVKMK